MHIGRYMTAAVFAVALPVFSSSGGALRDVSQYQSDHAQHGTDPAGGVINQVRRATANFRDFKYVKDAEYTQFLGCVSGPQEGAMGVHFVNSKYVGDDELDITKPEALIYEPYNGAYRLVGVQYIVMVDAWQAHHKDPPVLAGQTLQYQQQPEPVRPAGLLRAARVGVARQPAWHVRGLESARRLRHLDTRRRV